MKPRPIATPIADGDVDAGGIEIGRLKARIEAHLDVRVALPEIAEPRDQPAHGEGRQQADGERLGAGAVTKIGDHAGKPVESVLHLGKERLSRGGQRNPTRAAVQEPHAEIAFERLDLVAHRGFGDRKLLCRAAKARKPRHGLERPQTG